MEDLFNTSKTNWLELETDVAKTTNAAIEEVQKKNAQIFAMAIAEAKRAEEQRSKNYQNLQKLIGQAPKTIKSLQDWHDTKKENEEYDEDSESNPGKNVIPDDEGGKGKKKGEDKNETEENETVKYIEQLSNDQQKDRNTITNAYASGNKDISNQEFNLVSNTNTALDQIVAQGQYAPTFIQEYYSSFRQKYSGEEGRIRLRTIEEKGWANPNGDGSWTILEAEDAQRPEVVRELKKHYRRVFMTHPVMKNASKRIKRKVMWPMMRDIERKSQLASDARLSAAVLKNHIERRRTGLSHCLTNSKDKLSCAVGTAKNPRSGHVFTNEGLLDGTKSNTQGWRILLEDLEHLVDNDQLDHATISAMREGLVPQRGGGKDLYLNQMPNLKYIDNELRSLQAKAYDRKAKVDNAIKKGKIDALNNVALAKIKGDASNNIKIDNEYIFNLEKQLLEDIREEGYPVTLEELRALPNAIDKWYTFEEVADENITQSIDQLISNGIPIENPDSMLAHIDDLELKQQYAKKLDEHQVRLSLVDAEDAKKFNSFVLPTINKYLSLTQATTLKTPEKRDLIDNALKIYKEKVAATQETLGLDKAKILAMDEIDKEIALAAKEGEDLPGKYIERRYTSTDTDQVTRILSNEKYLDANKANALTDNKPWPIETPEVIQQAKDYLEGNAAPPIEYITAANKINGHTYHSLIETRVGIDPKPDKEGNEGSVTPPAEEGIPGLTDKSTNSTAYRAINSNDIEKILSIAQRTDDPNSLPFVSMDNVPPLERKGFGNRKLSELSVDEIRGLLEDKSFHGLYRAKFGMYHIPGDQLEVILNEEAIDGDRLFDKDLQNELALLNIKYKANKANSLSTIGTENTRLTKISRREQQDFLKIMEILPGEGKAEKLSEEEIEALKGSAEYQFLHSPWNDISILLPAVQEEVIQKDPSRGDPGWPFTTIYRSIDKRNKKHVKEIQEEAERIKQAWKEKERMFPQ